MNDSELAQARRLGTTIEQLPQIVNALSSKVGQPRYVEDGADSRFLYDTPGWSTYQVLKSVRLVSALRAAMVLLQYGHTVEVCCLLRTIDDFLAAIIFAQDAMTSGSNTADQQKEFDQFFQDFKDDPQRQIAGTFRAHRPERKKVQAAEARHLHPKNPYEVRMLVGAVDDLFSGYVHGSYSTIMELYAGGRDEFDMQGMLASPRIAEAVAALSYYLDMTVSSLTLIALNLKEPRLVEKLHNLQGNDRP